MLVITLIGWGGLLLYVVFFCWIYWGILKPQKPKKKEQLIPLSVIIPFRNEAQNIDALVQSFTHLNYNLNIVEFIFVNDHSEDDSLQFLSERLKTTNLVYKIITLPINKTGKKQALDTGISNSKSKNEYIITTDADTSHAKEWLMSYAQAFQNNSQFIIGPVINHHTTSFIGKLQNIEALLLAGITIGSANLNYPTLCSGANLGFTRTLYNLLTPYQDNFGIASGDDLFFLDKVIESNCKTGSLNTKAALVYTRTNVTYSAILKQAIRWSSKNKYLANKRNNYLSIVVFLVNCLVYVNLYLVAEGSFYAWGFLILKFLIDVFLLAITSQKFKQRELLFYAPFIYLLYPIHLMLIFVSPFLITPNWKGRSTATDEKN